MALESLGYGYVATIKVPLYSSALGNASDQAKSIGGTLIGDDLRELQGSLLAKLLDVALSLYLSESFLVVVQLITR